MSKHKKLSATSDPVDQAFGVLDRALRATGRLLADDESDIRCSEAEIDLESIQLPRALHDPMATLERGRYVLNYGFSAHPFYPSPPETTSRNMAQAARNGSHISDELREQMHRDRNESINKSNKA